MIRITIELLSANDGRRTTLGVMDIWNVSRRGADSKRGDYEGAIYRKGTCDPQRWGRNGVPTRGGRTLDFPRLTYPVWRLVLRMLLEMYPEERAERAAKKRKGTML